MRARLIVGTVLALLPAGALSARQLAEALGVSVLSAVAGRARVIPAERVVT